MKGYIKDFRKELESDIWSMPPLYHRVWQYLKYMVNHQDNEIPMADGSKLMIKTGQHLTSIRNIARGIGWYEGAKWKEPNPKTVSKIVEWLEKTDMITVNRGQGNRQYTLITLLNWDLYQEKEFRVTENGEGTGEAKKQSADINNNDNNVNNDKELNIVINKGLQNNFDDLDLIANRYSELKTIQQGKVTYANQRDYQAITRIVTQGVPTSQTIKLLEQCFADFETNNPGQSINSFSYCEKYILGQHLKNQQAERSSTDGQASNYHGRTRKEGKSLEQAMAELEADRKAWGG